MGRTTSDAAPTGTRTKRANGIASRDAILDAAAQVAGERGYEGASISAVSKLSGLPASSIYWHFADKDELVTAVIDRSFSAWVEALQQPGATPDGDDARDAFVATFRESARQLTQFPDFLRLGLMLTLELRPDELSARRRFLDSRSETLARIDRNLRRAFPGLADDDVTRLATLVLASSDGLFVAAQAEAVDLVEGFETLALAVWGAAEALRPRAD